MTERTGRLLSLLQVMREHRRPVTASTLAARFGLSERTIYRDLDALRALGAPIEGERGFGFILQPGFFLPPLALSTVEADAVVLGLRFVLKRGDPELADAARAALVKIGASMSEEIERAMLASGLTSAPKAQDRPDCLAVVREALKAERKLQLSYRNGAAIDTQRTVWPVALGFFEHNEVMVAWCELREAFRHFRLDRITSLDVLPQPLPRPRRLLLAEYKVAEPAAEL